MTTIISPRRGHDAPELSPEQVCRLLRSMGRHRSLLLTIAAAPRPRRRAAPPPSRPALAPIVSARSGPGKALMAPGPG